MVFSLKVIRWLKWCGLAAMHSSRFYRSTARPYAQLDRIRYVLLVWPKAKPEIDEQIAPPDAEASAVAGDC